MRVPRLVAVLVVYAMNASPPQRRALETANSQEHPETFEKKGKPNRPVGQHPVVTKIDTQRSEDEVTCEGKGDAPPHENRGKKHTKSEDMNPNNDDQKPYNHLFGAQLDRRCMLCLNTATDAHNWDVAKPIQ